MKGSVLVNTALEIVYQNDMNYHLELEKYSEIFYLFIFNITNWIVLVIMLSICCIPRLSKIKQ